MWSTVEYCVQIHWSQYMGFGKDAEDAEVVHQDVAGSPFLLQRSSSFFSKFDFWLSAIIFTSLVCPITDIPSEKKNERGSHHYKENKMFPHFLWAQTLSYVRLHILLYL